MLEVGRVTRPHGVCGDLVVILTTNRSERLDVGSVLTAADRELVVAHARPHKNSWIVGFRGVTDRLSAEALSGTVLRAVPLVDANELWVHELVGARVLDQDGVERGEVAKVVENPASDLLELDTGALVPLRFLTELVPTKRIVVDVPEGLFDIANNPTESAVGAADSGMPS
ncbi:MAG: ribosome maturation factor RimM [Acidimicrobiia bacterium]|nr:ribosome maturation factor RimM [Acidimicrobiia bacterium]MCY4458531.1 ribosome maturation factor RimM [Acidimicrobiaceae bacterium]